MAVTQYIGARYVPKFYVNSDGTEEWRAGVEYEPLTIVTYNGNSYTSKKPVPSTVGDPSANDEYWAATGNYNAQVEAYRQEVEEYKQQVDNLEDTSIKVLYPPLTMPASNGTNGSCQIIYTRNRCTIVDLGNYDTYATIRNAMQAAGIEKIDNVIITHWHADHSGQHFQSDVSHGYDHWKADFDMSKTVFWICNMPTAFDDGSADYLYQSFPNNTINVITDNGSKFTWYGTSWSVYNASEADFNYYDNNTNDYNAYSMIVYCEYGNTRICNTGDINDIAQRRAIDQGYVFKSDIMTIPHHGVNSAGIGEFTQIVNPLYAYISNFSVGYLAGLRDATMAEAAKAGILFDNVTNYRSGGVSFNITESSAAPAGSPIIDTGYAPHDTGHAVLYVDPTVSESAQQLGTSALPYKYMRRAISACKGYTEISLLNDTTETLVINGSNGYIKISGNNHKCGYVTAAYGAKLDLNNIEIGGANFIQAHAVLNTCRTTGTIGCSESLVMIKDLTALGDIVAVNGVRSFITVTGISTPSRTAARLFSFTECYATGSLALGSLNNVPAHIQSIRSLVDFGRLAESAVLLPSMWDPANPPLIVFDTTAGSFARLLSDGTLKHCTMS